MAAQKSYYLVDPIYADDKTTTPTLDVDPKKAAESMDLGKPVRGQIK